MDQADSTLRRRFTICCVGMFFVAFLTIGGLYRHISVQQLVKHSERANVALTKSFANALWPEIRAHVASARGLSGDALRARPETARIAAAVRGQMRGQSVIKVKIYDRSGLTVFSTEPSQMGALKGDNLGYSAAMRGRVVSALTFRDTIYSLEGTLSDRNIVSSYIPLRRAGRIEGVFEIYDDVTDPLMSLQALQLTMYGLIALVLVFSFGVLMAVVVSRPAAGQGDAAAPARAI